jgi:hypothetical protein
MWITLVRRCCCSKMGRLQSEAEPLTRDVQEDAMKRAVRLCVLAGLTSIAAMMTSDAPAADAYAQNCTAWLGWACRDSASSNKATRKDANTAIKGIRKEKKLSQARGPVAEKPKQTQALKPARPAQNGERHPVMNDQETDVLFQQFLDWEKDQSQNTGTSR